MLITVDVGNSETAIGMFEGRELINTWRLTTTLNRTGNEWELLIKSLLADADQTFSSLKGVCISSVVPVITDVLEDVFDNIDTIFVSHEKTAGIDIKIDDPRELGSDRIANAIAALNLHGRDCIIADFGTATTIDAVSAGGSYLGGSIAPGIGISSRALFRSGAQLNQIMLELPDRKLGKNTVDSLRSGIVWGTIYQIEGLSKAISNELVWNDPLHIVTGGLSGFIYPHSKLFVNHDMNLTLQGLRFAYEYYH